MSTVEQDQLIDPTLAHLPQHLIDAAKSHKSTGMEGMKDYLSPPRIKVCQASRKSDYKQFDEGTVLVIPQNDIVCKPGEFFIFTPIYAFDEFCVHNPWEMRDSLSMIRESTYDPDSEIARKCKNFVTEPCPENDKEEIKYCTHLNCVIYIHEKPEFANTQVILSLYLGEWKSGRKLMDLLAARTANGVPIYGHKIMASMSTTPRTSKGNEWYGLDFSNPSADYDGKPWVEDPKLYQQLEKAHDDLKANKEKIKVDFSDEEAEASSSVSSDTLG